MSNKSSAPLPPRVGKSPLPLVGEEKAAEEWASDLICEPAHCLGSISLSVSLWAEATQQWFIPLTQKPFHTDQHMNLQTISPTHRWWWNGAAALAEMGERACDQSHQENEGEQAPPSIMCCVISAHMRESGQRGVRTVAVAATPKTLVQNNAFNRVVHHGA